MYQLKLGRIAFFASSYWPGRLEIASPNFKPHHPLHVSLALTWDTPSMVFRSAALGAGEKCKSLRPSQVN